MNGHVAHGAGLVFLRLIVESRCSGWACVHREGMAFETNQVYLAAFQKARIRGAVRGMAGYTTFNLDRFVFEYEWTGFVRMALVTDGVLSCRGS